MPKKKSVNAPSVALEDLLQDLSDGISHGIRNPNLHSYVPHDKQVLFHKSRKKGRQYIGGNRSGKTTGGINEDLWWLTGTHPFIETPRPPVRGRICTVDFKQGVKRIILPQIQQWLPKSYLINGSWEDSYNSNDNILKLNNGSWVEIMSYEQDVDKFAGTSRHFIHFDEEPPKAIFGECKLRLVDTGGSYWVTETPVEGMTWTFEEIYTKGKEGDPYIDVIEVEITDNPHLDVAAIEEILAGLDEEERKIRGTGRYVAIGGAIFRFFGDHLILDTSERLWRPPANKGWKVYQSVDHGFSNPTAWLWHAVSPDGIVVTFDEHYKSDMTIDQHCDIVLEKEEEYMKMGIQPFLRICDPACQQRQAATGLSVRIMYGQRGLNLVLGKNDVAAGINKMNQYMQQNKWFITSNCVNFLKEIPKYRRKSYMSPKLKDRSNLYEEPLKKDDHACDSARYFFSFMPELNLKAPEDKTGLTKEDIASMIGPGTTFRPNMPVRYDHNLTRPQSTGFPDYVVIPDDDLGREW